MRLRFAPLLCVLLACGPSGNSDGDVAGDVRTDIVRPPIDVTVDDAEVDTAEDAAADAEEVGEDTPADVESEVDVEEVFSCTPGETRCLSRRLLGTCTVDGTAETQIGCEEDEVCFEDVGECVEVACQPGATQCNSEATALEVCLSDGSAWVDGDPCGETEYCAGNRCIDRSCLPNVMFAIDGSSDMIGEYELVRASVDAVMSANPDVSFGLMMFPVTLGCSIDGDGASWPHVPIQPAETGAIDDWFDANGPALGATPLIQTLNWLGENAEAVWGPERDSAYLVLLTDGVETCRCDDGEEIGCMVEEMNELTATGVRTYAIAYKADELDPAPMNAIARAGGTGIETAIAAGDEDALTEAFVRVITDAKLCE